MSRTRLFGGLSALAFTVIACSIAAPEDPYFVGGTRCPEGQKLCGTECASVAAPEVGCAAESCAPCPSGLTTCSAGQCAAPCATGKVQCASNACTELASDPENCGGCGTRCVLNHARAACSSGTCAVGACEEGFADCNGLPGDGCEESLRTSATSCGACKSACAAPNECFRGQCGAALACHAIRFTSPASRVIFSNTGLDTGDGDFSIEMWLKITGGWSAAEIFRFNDGPPVSSGVHLSMDGDGILCALVGSGASGPGTGSPILKATGATQGRWVHVACQRTGSDLALYVDGKRAAHDLVTTPVVASGTGAFGFAPDTTYAAPVLIGPVRISKVARYTSDFTPESHWSTDANTLAEWLSQRPGRTSAPDELGGKRSLRFQGDIALELEDLPCVSP